MELTSSQLKAIELFEEFGYLVIEGARASGKTTILQEIVCSNPNIKIGVKALNREVFELCYSRFKNCEYYKEGEEYDLLIGDEVLIKKSEAKKAISAYTPNHIVWRLPTRLEGVSEKGLGRENFMIMYGQFNL